MDTKKILEILKKAANLEPELKNGKILGVGAINMCDKCKDMTEYEYRYEHYPNMSELLESLPWTHTIPTPRNPRETDYPDKPGEYLTMLDCNEHEVVCNTYHEDGRWTLYNRTHIKWWMSWPDDIRDYLKERQNSD